jgi:hypothetical protein
MYLLAYVQYHWYVVYRVHVLQLLFSNFYSITGYLHFYDQVDGT